MVYGGMPLAAHVALVGVGQAISCIGGGLVLLMALEKSGVTRRLS